MVVSQKTAKKRFNNILKNLDIPEETEDSSDDDSLNDI